MSNVFERGRVKWFNADRGFGYIQFPETPGKSDLWFHIKDQIRVHYVQSRNQVEPHEVSREQLQWSMRGIPKEGEEVLFERGVSTRPPNTGIPKASPWWFAAHYDLVKKAQALLKTGVRPMNMDDAMRILRFTSLQGKEDWEKGTSTYRWLDDGREVAVGIQNPEKTEVTVHATSYATRAFAATVFTDEDAKRLMAYQTVSSHWSGLKVFPDNFEL